jgi:putative transposase
MFSDRHEDTVAEARASIGRYLDFYNAGRPRSQRGSRTPDQVWFASLQAVRVAA